MYLYVLGNCHHLESMHTQKKSYRILNCAIEKVPRVSAEGIQLFRAQNNLAKSTSNQ